MSKAKPPTETETVASPSGDERLSAALGVVVLTGARRGERIDLVQAATIGRSSDASFSIDDPGASRVHVRLVRTSVPQPGVRVTDLGSRNGTFVAGKRIEGELVLVPGDLFSVGGSTFEVRRVVDWERERSDEARRCRLQLSALTPREGEVAQAAATGLSQKEIAAALGISASTVARHLESAHRRLSINNRAELTRLVMLARLDEPVGR